jgi:hypothetical protein
MGIGSDFSESEDAVPPICNSQSTTLAAGKLLLHTFSFDGAPFSLLTPREISAGLGVEPLWPAVNSPVQAPWKRVGFNGFEAIATGVFRLLVRE